MKKSSKEVSESYFRQLTSHARPLLNNNFWGNNEYHRRFFCFVTKVGRLNFMKRSFMAEMGKFSFSEIKFVYFPSRACRVEVPHWILSVRILDDKSEEEKLGMGDRDASHVR